MAAIQALINDCVSVPYVLRVGGKIVFIAVLGGLGGFIFAVSKLLEAGREGTDTAPVWKATAGVPRNTYLLWQTAIGSGGAFAAVFGILTIGNATGTGSTGDMEISIRLAALCVIGGFVGNQLLIKVGQNLLNEIDRLKEKGQETKRQVEETERKVAELTRNKNQLTSDLSSVRAEMKRSKQLIRDIYKARETVDKLESCRDKPIKDSLRSDAIEQMNKLKGYKAESAADRFFTIVFANLNFELGLRQEFAAHQDQAFAALEEFLAGRRKAGEAEDEDDEAAWYNIACYSAVLSARSQESNQAGEWVARTLKALTESLRIAKAIGKNQLRGRISKCEQDPDLRSVLENGPFRSLLDSVRDPDTPEAPPAIG
jgi:hypothetical protein